MPTDPTLARTLAAAPWFPRYDDIGSVYIGDLPGGAPMFFANDLVWTREWDGPTEVMVPLLSHAATAGALVGMLNETGRLREIRPPVCPGADWIVAVSVEAPAIGVVWYSGPTLGHAAGAALLSVRGER